MLQIHVQVLQVAAGELLVSNDLDLSITLLGDLDNVAKVTGAALDLDAVVQELLESLDVEDLVVDGLRAVDDELLGDLLALLRAGGGLLLHYVLSLLFYAWSFSAQRTAKRCTYGGGSHCMGCGRAQRSGYPAQGV
jgi:hypothetical protein